MNEQTDKTEFRNAVNKAIHNWTIVEDNGCYRWYGPVSHYWDYPVVRVNDTIINVRAWSANARLKNGGKTVPFFTETCGTKNCIKQSHLHIENVFPTTAVRAFEARIRAERNGEAA